MKISIIIPIYNSEKYLRSAVESVTQQSYKDIEIILINDGSTDKSLNICQEYSKIDSRIILINKKNEGVSATRNRGIEVATGEFIMFLDADDWIEKEACEILLNKIINSNADIVFCNHIMEFEHNNKKVSMNISDQIINNKDIKEKIILPLIEEEDMKSEHLRAAFRGPWGKLFKKSIIDDNNIRFKEDLIIGEDFMFNLEYLKYSNNVIVDERYLYHYRLNNGSALNKYRGDFWIIYKKILINLENYLEESLGDMDYSKRLNKLKLKYLLICIKNEANPLNKKSLKKRKEYIKNICEDSIIKDALKNHSRGTSNIKDRIILFLLRNNMNSVVALYSILKR